MSQRLVSILVKTVGFFVLSAITVTTVYGYRFDPVDGSLSQQGILDITRTSTETRLIIDGEEVHSTKLHIIQSLPVGRHTIRLERIGYKSFEVQSNFQNQNANQFGIVHLMPERARLEMVGMTTVLPKTQTKQITPEMCSIDFEVKIDGSTLCHSEERVLLDNQIIGEKVKKVEVVGSKILMVSEHEINLYDTVKKTRKAIYRTMGNISGITAGPNNQYLFIAIGKNIQFCDMENSYCVEALSATNTVEKLSFDSTQNTLSIQMPKNQILQVQIPFENPGIWSDLL